MSVVEIIRGKRKIQKIEKDIIASMQNYDFAKAVYLDQQQREINEAILKMVANDKNINPFFAKMIRGGMSSSER